MTILVVIPTYNEADNLPAITAELFTLELAEELHILIVDDASPDGTGQVADDLVKKCYPGRLHVIHRSGKLGLGTAYITGFKWALARDYDHIIQMDADFSHSPGYIAQMIEKITAYDVVVGSRYVAGGDLDERWGWWRWFLSWWANSVWTRLILGVSTKDATAGFKCWRRSALQRIGLDRINSNGYVFQVEMAYVAEKLNFRILEIPIYFEDRRIGQSKMTVPVKIEAALRVFEIRWRHRRVQPLPLPHSTRT
ncbi:MAG: polyprenol monophosphomannose synthase [Chloroflexota bacterium]